MAINTGVVHNGNGEGSKALLQNNGATIDREREELYREVSLPGDPIPCNSEPTDVDDTKPSNVELRALVKGLPNGHTVGARGMRAEHLKEWLSGILTEEKGEGRQEAGKS